MSSHDVEVSFTSDAQYVYAAELTHGRGHFLLKNLTRMEIGPDFKEAVLKAVQKAGFRGCKAVLALSGHEAIVRCFEMPFIPRREVPNAVRFEAQKYMPFEAKELRSDYETYPDLKRRKLRAIFLAARKDLIERWVGALKVAGVETSTVEPDLLALLRLLAAHPDKKKNETQALVSARADGGLDVLVVKDQKPLMARYGVVAPSSAKENSEFGRYFESFAKEIALSFNYFSKNFRNEEIRRIVWLADSSYESEKWIQGLHARFEIPVEEWNLSNFLGKSEPFSPATAVLIGAALRSVRKSPDFLSGLLGRKVPNLLPVAVKEVQTVATLAWEDEKKLLIRQAMNAAVMALAAIFAIHLLFLPAIGAARKNRGILADSSLTQLKETKARLETQVAYLGALVEKRTFWSEKLSGLAKHVPAKIQLVQMEATDVEDKNGESSLVLKIDGNIVLSEAGKELSVANRFIGALMADPDFMRGFESALLTRVRKAQQEGGSSASLLTAFTLECASKGKASV